MTIIDNRELRRRLRDHGGPLLPGEVIALHVWDPPDALRKTAPTPFRRARQWGHLFGKNALYLRGVAERCGVTRVMVHREGEKMQHVDLCGKALRYLVMPHLVPAHDIQGQTSLLSADACSATEGER